MSIREILQHPDPRLRTVAEPVPKLTAEVCELCADLVQTMRYSARAGMGLAAPQVGVPLRIFVMDEVGKKAKRQSHVCINPVIRMRSGEASIAEGCLSFPADASVRIPRAARIRLAYQMPSGRHVTRSFDGILAICAQHEIDHLDGKLMVDYGELTDAPPDH